MANLVVIYDSDRELAAIVDTDTRMGWGPAMIGPQAGDILAGWVESMPFDVGILDPHTANRVFQEWVEGLVAAASQAAPASLDGSLEPSGGPSLDSSPPDRTGPADGGTEPPAPAPADTDMEADAGPPPTVVQCPLCGGDGVTADGEDGATKTCPMCAGTKVVRMAVQS